MTSAHDGSGGDWQVFGQPVSPAVDLRAFSSKAPDDDLAPARPRRRPAARRAAPAAPARTERPGSGTT